MEYILKTENLSKIYGEKAVLDNINMELKKGTIYALIGENGAGKTTLIKLLSGLAIPTKGSVEYPKFTKEKNSSMISVTLEKPGLIENLTGFEHMKAKAMLCGASNEEIVNILKTVSLFEAANKKVKNYSMGMKQRLAIGLALINKPKLIFFDEPINGLDPQGIKWFRDLVINLNKTENISFLISSHILSELSLIANEFGFMHNGRLILTTTCHELEDHCSKNNMTLENFYFNLLQNPNKKVTL